MITVVAGPPCGGKTTYVNTHHAPGAVIVDFDALAVALGSETFHDHTPEHVPATRAARAAAIETVLADQPARGAWIVDTAPTRSMLARYRRAGAHLVVVDPGLDECLRRAELDGRPDWTIREIHRWYATHSTGAPA